MQNFSHGLMLMLIILYFKLQDTLASKKTFSDHSDTLFSLLLSDEGCEEFDTRRNREDAIICESMKTCEDKSWSSMLHCPVC